MTAHGFGATALLAAALTLAACGGDTPSGTATDAPSGAAVPPAAVSLDEASAHVRDASTCDELVTGMGEVMRLAFDAAAEHTADEWTEMQDSGSFPPNVDAILTQFNVASQRQDELGCSDEAMLGLGPLVESLPAPAGTGAEVAKRDLLAGFARSDAEASFAADAADLLKNAATAQESFYVEHQTYTDDVVALEDEGLTLPSGITFEIARADADGFCMHVFAVEQGEYRFDSSEQTVEEGVCRPQ